MTQIYSEGGLFTLLFASIFFLGPLYLILRATKNKSEIRKALIAFKLDPFRSFLTVCMTIGYVGFVLWVFSDGHLSTGYFGVFAVVSWVAYEVFRKRKTG